MLEDKMHQREKTSFLTVKNEADKRSMKDTNSANSSDVPDKGKSSLRRTFCAVCGAQNVPENMRRPPQEAEYTIVLLASLCMQELIRSAQTKKIYSKRSGVRRRYICQDHYIQAAGHLGRKTKVIWGKFPQEGLCNLPEEILCKLVEDLRVYSENIDKNVVLNSSHIVSFFDDCLERYHKITGWKRRNKGGKKRNHGQKNKSLSSNDCHRIDSPDPGALSAGEPERKAALLESVNDANRLSHSANVEEEPLPPEDVKPSCSTDCTANQLHSSEIHTFQEQQRLESVDSAKQEVVTCGTEPVLTETQRYFRLQNCASLLERSCKESLLSRMVTFGERWILYDMEEQTARCVNEMELPKKLEPHQRKLLVAVWWTASGAVHHAFHRNCDAINEDWYCGEIVSMHKKLLLQQRAMRNSKSPMYLHDNERWNESSVIVRNLFELGYEVLVYPSHSPDLLPSEYHLFPEFNEYLRHQVLSNVKDVEDAFQRFLETKTDAFFSAGINKLVPRWKKCLEVNGNYFDE